LKLAELNPKIDLQKVLVFDCPCGQGHKLRLPMGPEKTQWTATGDLANLTLTESVEVGCWHGFIKKGEIISA
jgi:hypothetical protein